MLKKLCIVLPAIITIALMFSIASSAEDVNIKYGKTSITVKVIDDFSDSGEPKKVWRDGSVTLEDGKVVCEGTYIADCYLVEIPKANENKNLYIEAKYIGLELTNKSDGSIYYCFQGTIDDEDALTSPMGEEDIILVDKDGNLHDVVFSDAPNVYERYGFIIPKDFDGYVIIPTSSITRRGDWETPLWHSEMNIDGVGAHVSLGGSATPQVDASVIELVFDNFFVFNGELPDPNAEPETSNPQTSDPFAVFPPFLIIASMLLLMKEFKKRYSV